METIELQQWAVQACQHTCVLTWQAGREDRCTESSHWPSRSPSHSTQGHTCHSGRQRCCGHSSGIPRFKRRGKQQETIRTPSHLETAQQHPQFTSVDSFFFNSQGRVSIFGHILKILNTGSSAAFIHCKTAFIHCVCACWVTESCPTLCDLMDCNPPGSSTHGILQARIQKPLQYCKVISLQLVQINGERKKKEYWSGLPWPRDWTHISCIGSRFFTTSTTREAHSGPLRVPNLLKWLVAPRKDASRKNHEFPQLSTWPLSLWWAKGPS